MKAATLKALRLSIKKWERIVEGTGYDAGTDNCALCQRFTTEYCTTESGKETCPVAIKAKRVGCVGTPYLKFAALATNYANNLGAGIRIAESGQAKKAAKVELAFLKSLLPDENES